MNHLRYGFFQFLTNGYAKPLKYHSNIRSIFHYLKLVGQVSHRFQDLQGDPGCYGDEHFVGGEEV